MGTQELEKIFHPKKIAVIGASDREGSLGGKVLQNLIGVGFKGAVYPVNPFRPTVQGMSAYPNIGKIHWQVDLAIIATPAHTVPQMVEECGKAGVGRARPHETLTRYCNLDYDREIAIVAETREDKRRILGVGRLIVEPGRECGEFAVVVADQWQGLGLGSKLIDYTVEIAKDLGLETIYGYIISMNTKMVHLCTSKGFRMKAIDEEVTRVTLQLPPTHNVRHERAQQSILPMAKAS